MDSRVNIEYIWEIASQLEMLGQDGNQELILESARTLREAVKGYLEHRYQALQRSLDIP